MNMKYFIGEEKIVGASFFFFLLPSYNLEKGEGEGVFIAVDSFFISFFSFC